MRGLRLAVLCSIVLGLFSTAVLADGPQVYKWTDSQGVVHYSDKAPTTPQQPVKLMTLAPLPAVDAQTEAQNQAWIASVHQWYQSMVAQELAQQYNQILAWQSAQQQTSDCSVESGEDVSSTTQVYAGYAPYYYQHQHHHKHHDKRPGHTSTPPLAFKPTLWNTQPNAFSQQLFNTNPNGH